MSRKIAIIIFLLLSMSVIWKTFLGIGSFAFDSSDDRLITFPSLFISRTILSQGEIPRINFYNNFGTPLLGDSNVHQFSLFSITYAFLRPAYAMSLNRFIICFLTLYVLFIFFSSYFSTFHSFLLSIIVFFHSNYLWFFATHHYQNSLLFFALMLLILKKFDNGFISEQKTFILLFVTMLFSFLSINISILCYVILFTLLYPIILSKEKRKNCYIIIISSILISLFLTYPQWFDFFQSIKSSERMSSIYGLQFPFQLNDLIGLFFFQHKKFDNVSRVLHYHRVLYFSMPLIVLSVIGLYYHFYKRKTFESLFLLITGLLPIFLVLFLISNRIMWGKIPFIKSNDITRVFHVSNVFWALLVGYFFKSISDNAFKKQLIILFSLIFSLFILIILGIWKYVTQISLIGIITLAVFIVFNFFYCYREKNNYIKLISNTLLIIVIALVVYPNFYYILGFRYSFNNVRPSHHFSPISREGFYPKELLNKMESYYRMASGFPVFEGFDQTCWYNKVLGSNAQNILLDQGLMGYLHKREMIEIETNSFNCHYHFKSPWNKTELEKLGIRYIISNGPSIELEDYGFKLLGNKDNYYLYDNPIKPTPAYFIQNDSKIIYSRNYKFAGNSIIIARPETIKAKELVATFTVRPGWSLYIDGKERKYYNKEDRLLRVPIENKDEIIVITYKPYSDYCYMFFIVISISLFISLVFYYKKIVENYHL